MSTSGINYTYTGYGLPLDGWQVFYDFSSGSAYLPSVPFANTVTSGKPVGLSSFANNGTGIFNGQGYFQIQNSTGNLTDWTILVSFEKKTLNEGVLFSSYSSGVANSGFVIGVNSVNKIYVESYDVDGPFVIESPTILSNKNATAITKIGRSLYIDYFDFNSKEVESNQYDLSEDSFLNSNKWYLGGFSGTPSYFSGRYFSGNMYNFLLLNTPIRPSEISSLFRGFYTDISLGVPTENTGDILSYGMRGISYLSKLDAYDNAELYLFPGVHNKTNLNKDGVFDRTVGEFFGFELQTGNDRNVFVNGVAQLFSTGYSYTGDYYNNGYDLSGNYINSGYQFFSNGKYFGDDRLVYDISSGVRNSFNNFKHTGITQVIPCSSSWDLVFFNGVKLVLGVDYVQSGATNIVFPNGDYLYDGITGNLFTMPIDPSFVSGNYRSGVYNSIYTGTFARNTSMFWLNGIRQNLGETYLEISTIDLLSGSGVFPQNTLLLFNNPSLFWENF